MTRARLVRPGDGEAVSGAGCRKWHPVRICMSAHSWPELPNLLVPGGGDWELHRPRGFRLAIYLRPPCPHTPGLQHLIRRAEELSVVDHHAELVL